MVRCARMASLTGVSGLNWLTLNGEPLYSVIVL